MRTLNFARNGRSIGLVAAGLVVGAVLAGTVSANAADDSSAPTAGSTRDGGHRGHGPGGHGTPASADAAEKAKAAVLAKYPDATVHRVTVEDDGTYVAHAAKADSTRIHVLLDKDFAVTGEEVGGPGRGGPGGPGGKGMHGTPVSEDAAKKIEAAVVAKYPGATVEHSMAKPDGTYEAHVTKADATRVHVLLDKDFAVTGEETGPPAGRGGRGGGHGGHGPGGPRQAPAAPATSAS